MVALEAFAAGVPMLASRIGAYEEIIRDGVSGFHFQPGDAHELSQRISNLWEQTRLLDRVAESARTEFNEKYSPETNLRSLEAIYQSTISKHRLAAVRSH
jgi:glycosyltransferase involved in cell wall biosynthesis